VINWFHSDLNERQQQITILGATSTPLPVTSGMPQGFIRYSAQHRFYCAKIIFQLSLHVDTNIFKKINSEQMRTPH
jgi:hypothetical protein